MPIFNTCTKPVQSEDCYHTRKISTTKPHSLKSGDSRGVSTAASQRPSREQWAWVRTPEPDCCSSAVCSALVKWVFWARSTGLEEFEQTSGRNQVQLNRTRREKGYRAHIRPPGFYLKWLLQEVWWEGSLHPEHSRSRLFFSHFCFILGVLRSSS